jgi:Periplasmic copper-binding protein (NosD)
MWFSIASLVALPILLVAASETALSQIPRTATDSSQPAATKPSRTVIRVGPTRRLKLPSQAAKIAQNGSIVEIDAGTYNNCAVWRQNDLLLKGVGGRVRLRRAVCQRKAIWVIYGTRVTVENIRFSYARSIHRNGAGIRFEGGTLKVRNSYFDRNQMGILTHNKRPSALEVYDSVFEQNGDCPSFCGHGIYAGFISRLRVVRSKFRGQKFGHHIKSRARYTEIIGNRIEDGQDGTASFAIDLPNSGTASIRSNFIQKGPSADNRKAMISIGEEGAKKSRAAANQMNPSRGLVIQGNVLWNQMNRPTIFVWNRSPHIVKMIGNSFQGPGRKLRGYGRVY